MRRTHKRLPLLAIAAAAMLLVAPALADPTEVHLTSLPDWEQASILPVLEWNEALEGLHPGQQESYRPPQLYVLPELIAPEGGIDQHPGLLMAWGDPADTGEIISAWELVLPVDPDLTGMCITLTAWPRTGMTSISFSLQDINGAMKGWRWPVGPGGLPVNVPTTLVVAASGGPGQAGSTGFWDGGIDLTQIVSFEFDESGIAQGGIPLPNGLPGFVGQWNYWHDIIVFPCPLTGPEHFTCYKVRPKTPLPPIFVSLIDQFLIHEQVELHRVREICTPADKNGEGITDVFGHLVCYQFLTDQRVRKDVLVINQFGEQELKVRGKLRRLCVPSEKFLLDGEVPPG